MTCNVPFTSIWHTFWKCHIKLYFQQEHIDDKIFFIFNISLDIDQVLQNIVALSHLFLTNWKTYITHWSSSWLCPYIRVQYEFDMRRESSSPWVCNSRISEERFNHPMRFSAPREAGGKTKTRALRQWINLTESMLRNISCCSGREILPPTHLRCFVMLQWRSGFYV